MKSEKHFSHGVTRMKHGFSKLFALALVVLLPFSLNAGDGFVRIQGGQATRDATGQSARLATTTSGTGDDRIDTLKTSGGAGAGGDASAANQTAVQADPGSNASKATAVQGIDSGKPLSVKIDQTTPGTTDSVTVKGAQYTVAIAVATTDGTVAAGKRHIEFILSSDFVGTIQSAAITGAMLGVYDPGTPPVGSTLAGITYTIAAGSATITTW